MFVRRSVVTSVREVFGCCVEFVTGIEENKFQRYISCVITVPAFHTFKFQRYIRWVKLVTDIRKMKILGYRDMNMNIQSCFHDGKKVAR